VRTFSVVPIASFLALVLSQATNAQSGAFDVSQLGHPVGTASYNFVQSSGGYDSSSVVRVSMKGLEYALSKTEELSSANELKHVQLSAAVNGSAVSINAAPDAAQLLLNISANGRSTTTRLAEHESSVFLPDFDPGALQTLLNIGASRNNRDLWAVLPKQSGNQAALVAPIQLATYPDEQGTFDGAAVTVHHLIATINDTRTDLFSGPENQLFQAELPQQGFALIRKGFVLKPPAKPPVQAPVQPSNPSTPPAS
jgi:hypothetical protein